MVFVIFFQAAMCLPCSLHPNNETKTRCDQTLASNRTHTDTNKHRSPKRHRYKQTQVPITSQHFASVHQLLKAHIICVDVYRSWCLKQHQTLIKRHQIFVLWVVAGKSQIKLTHKNDKSRAVLNNLWKYKICSQIFSPNHKSFSPETNRNLNLKNLLTAYFHYEHVSWRTAWIFSTTRHLWLYSIMFPL